jgi:hypothetical protein
MGVDATIRHRRGRHRGAGAWGAWAFLGPSGAAASAAGLSTARLRRELKKAHCLQYRREEKKALIEEVCAGNPAALAEIRAKSENAMAKVAAIRQSEAMRQTAHEESPGGFRPVVPGLVVVIESRDGTVRTVPSPMPQMIEVEPLRDRAELEPPGR